MFYRIKTAVQWLESQTKFKPKTDLLLLKEVFLAQSLFLNNIKKIHVTGTNGKGSTCSFLTNILTRKYKVGTFTSPYLMRFNERIKINNISISNKELLSLINQVFLINQDLGGKKLSFFELLTLMSLIHFSNQAVDVIIMEVGIGGLLDATNILNYDVSIITNVSLDHIKQLGSTRESILQNKLGILKKGGHLITSINDELLSQIVDFVHNLDASLDNDFEHKIISQTLTENIFNYQKTIYQISLIGDHQVFNAINAIKAAQYLDQHLDIEDIKQALKQTLWSGRMEQVLQNPKVYLDGAHNPHAIEAVVEVLKHYQEGKVFVLFSSLGDKDNNSMISKLTTLSQNIYLTSFPDKRLTKFGSILVDFPEIVYINDSSLAYHTIINTMNKSDLLLITGSLHFIGYLKNSLKF